MNTSTPDSNRPTANGIHPGVWIGGGLMSLAIVALATTLVVKNNDAASNTAAAASSPLVTATAAAQQSAANNQRMGGSPQPVPVYEPTRPVHHVPAPVHRDAVPYYDAPQQVAAVPVCATCGVIDGYSAVQVQGQNNGIGAVAGGLGGALVGSKIAGRSNHTLGGVIGAVGGGLLGNAIESHERGATMYDVRVRMADGSIRTVRQSTVPNVGQRVNVEGNTLRATDGQG